MKTLLTAIALLLVSISALATDEPKTCLIVSQPHAFGWTYSSTRRMHYVAGEFPRGIKWKSNLSDGDVRKIQEAGGHVAMVPANYTSADLEQAKADCANDKGKSKC